VRSRLSQIVALAGCSHAALPNSLALFAVVLAKLMFAPPQPVSAPVATKSAFFTSSWELPVQRSQPMLQPSLNLCVGAWERARAGGIGVRA
jgi:hypothetical protein